MKYFSLAVLLAIGTATIASPAHAAKWSVDYSGWWEADGGGSISGYFSAAEDDALDGIISIDEMTSWLWKWSGNDLVEAFTVSSGRAGSTADFFPSFYVDGTPNLPSLIDGLDQGTFTSGSGNEVLDLEFLFVTSFATGSEVLSVGNPDSTTGTITVQEVPEPMTLMGLIALVGTASMTLGRQRQSV